MAEECTHNCESCSADCASRSKDGNTGKESLLIPANPASEVKHIIGVVSGKGGVGKSLVTSMLAGPLRREGFRVGIMDADITGPSIPKAFGVHNVRIYGDDNGMIPPATTTGIDMISVNLLLGEDETRPVIWRGAMISGVVQQFWKDTIWNEDILLVDCPPGTGDVPLTVFQSMPLDGIIIVTSPQELVSMIVGKAVNMPDISEKRYNRLELKEKLLKNIWNEELMMEKKDYTVAYTEDAISMMDERMILKSDVERVLSDYRENQEAIFDEETKELVTRSRLGNVTFWVRFVETEEGYLVRRAYSHRMNIMKRVGQ